MKHIKNIQQIILKLNRLNLLKISDEKFIKIQYYDIFHKKINLKNPKTFNEKINWLKINDRKEIYTTMVDKIEVKKYIANIIGDEYIIPTLGIYDKFGDINLDILPEKFVLKCNHYGGSEGVYICDKKKSNFYKIKKNIDKLMKKNLYDYSREWPYKNVKPRIIIEKYMGSNLNDYKFFCFNGNPEIILTCSNRFSKNGLCEDFYDKKWNHLELKRPNIKNNSEIISKPKELSLMLDLSKKISKNMSFERIDFYEIDGKIYFGEITLYPAAGMEGFEPEEWDKKLGDLIKLPID